MLCPFHQALSNAKVVFCLDESNAAPAKVAERRALGEQLVDIVGKGYKDKFREALGVGRERQPEQKQPKPAAPQLTGNHTARGGIPREQAVRSAPSRRPDPEQQKAFLARVKEVLGSKEWRLFKHTVTLLVICFCSLCGIVLFSLIPGLLL